MLTTWDLVSLCARRSWGSTQSLPLMWIQLYAGEHSLPGTTCGAATEDNGLFDLPGKTSLPKATTPEGEPLPTRGWTDPLPSGEGLLLLRNSCLSQDLEPQMANTEGSQCNQLEASQSNCRHCPCRIDLWTLPCMAWGKTIYLNVSPEHRCGQKLDRQDP
jgi:hypothetical protein